MDSRKNIDAPEGAADKGQRVGFEDAVRYLDSVGVTTKCPSCGAENGQILTEEEPFVAVYSSDAVRLQKDNTIVRVGAGRVFFMISCGRCGFLRSFTYERLLEWVENNPAKANEQR